MADSQIPQEMIDWMNARNWGNHHVEWHFTRRWDFWHALAPGNAEIQAMVDAAVASGWTRATLQEGELRSGLDFLAMHRAMLILLHRDFPHHSHYLRGWTSPPTDPADTADPVPSGDAFQVEKVQAIAKLESPTVAQFPTEDSWGMYLETNLRPLPGNPTNRTPDLETGIHNYMHNRWSDDTSPVDLGDPQVNILNQRFWKLHGWIDLQWWRLRLARGLSDSESSYRTLLQFYLKMMDSAHPHHGRELAPGMLAPKRGVFKHFFKS